MMDDKAVYERAAQPWVGSFFPECIINLFPEFLKGKTYFHAEDREGQLPDGRTDGRTSVRRRREREREREKKRT